MRSSDALGSLAFMLAGANAPVPYVLGILLLALCAMVASRVIRKLKEIKR